MQWRRGTTGLIAALLCLLLAACGGPSRSDLEGAIERAWAETPALMQGAAEGSPGWEAGVANAAGLASDTAETMGAGVVAGAARAVVGGAVGLAADAGLEPARTLDQKLSLKFATNWRVSSLAVLEQRGGENGEVVVAVRYDLDADRRQGTGRIVHQGRQTLRLSREGGRWVIQSATPLDSTL